jgi:hypothetical protein
MARKEAEDIRDLDGTDATTRPLRWERNAMNLVAVRLALLLV